MYQKKLISVLLAVALAFCFCLSANAEELADGSVKGLPEQLVVLDDSGNSVSDNGDYYFVVENMEQAETYTKKIQIMNLREDESYKITFRAQPVSKEGEIDLENDCECVITLDGITIYSGKITGEGTPDIRDNALDLGVYNPGESKSMVVSITWNGSSAGDFIDNGQRVVTSSGTEIVREKSGDNYIYGEAEFKWTFYAEVVSDDSDIPTESTPNNQSGSSSPDDINNFIPTGETIAFSAIVLVMVAMIILVFLLIDKKKKQNNKT